MMVAQQQPNGFWHDARLLGCTPAHAGVDVNTMNQKTMLKAREIERIENTSIAVALGGLNVAGAADSQTCSNCCTGICVGVICSLVCLS